MNAPLPPERLEQMRKRDAALEDQVTLSEFDAWDAVFDRRALLHELALYRTKEVAR